MSRHHREGDTRVMRMACAIMRKAAAMKRNGIVVGVKYEAVVLCRFVVLRERSYATGIERIDLAGPICQSTEYV